MKLISEQLSQEEEMDQCLIQVHPQGSQGVWNLTFTNNEFPNCGAISIPHSHPSWAQIFASGSCFQIPGDLLNCHIGST